MLSSVGLLGTDLWQTVWEVLAGVWTPTAFPLLSWGRALGPGTTPRLSWVWWELTWMVQLAQSAQV